MVAAPQMITDAQMDALEEMQLAHRLLARIDPAAFCSYVLREEGTNAQIVPQPMHEEWHDLITQNEKVVIWAHPEAGKTQQVSIGRALWELGCNPDTRIVILANTDEYAQKICLTIARYIESSEALHEVFPNLRRDQRAPWNSHQLTVERRSMSKDPSVQTAGAYARTVMGARIDLLIIDDILTWNNATSDTHRTNLWSWYQSTITFRPKRMVCIGTAWHRDDLMHRLASTHGVVAYRYPVIDDKGKSSWPTKFTPGVIEAKRKSMTITEWNRTHLCIARSDEEARFKRAWVDTCLMRGNGRALATAGLETIPQGYAIYSGVDLSAGKKKSDLSCIFTIAVHPDDSREVIMIESGRWTADVIVEKIIDTHKRFSSIIMVESNAVQSFIAQFVNRLSSVPIREYTTTAATFRDPVFGLESMAVELSNGKWIIPNDNGKCHPEVAAWINELLYYDPNAHAGDRLMASFFARENTKRKKLKGRVGKIDLLSR